MGARRGGRGARSQAREARADAGGEWAEELQARELAGRGVGGCRICGGVAYSRPGQALDERPDLPGA
jgi:hypothetical protein